LSHVPDRLAKGHANGTVLLNRTAPEFCSGPENPLMSALQITLRPAAVP
jgi:hypothetical protein